MTTNTINAKIVRDLAASLDLDCEITTDRDLIVIDVCGCIETCSTLEEACQTVREHAKH